MSKMWNGLKLQSGASSNYSNIQIDVLLYLYSVTKISDLSFVCFLKWLFLNKLSEVYKTFKYLPISKQLVYAQYYVSW